MKVSVRLSAELSLEELERATKEFLYEHLSRGRIEPKTGHLIAWDDMGHGSLRKVLVSKNPSKLQKALSHFLDVWEESTRK